MICALTITQQKQLLAKVYKDLLEKSKSDKEFSLQNYIKEMHDLVLKHTGNKKLALTYSQLVPEYVGLVLMASKDLKKQLREKGLNVEEVEDYIDKYEDFNNVSNDMNDELTLEKVEDLKTSLTEDLKQPEELPEVTAETIKQENEELRKLFLFKAFSLLSTTGQQAIVDEDGKYTNMKDPEKEFYYSFLDKLVNAISTQGGNTEEITIGNHKGFKLKVVNKNQIPIEKAAENEQRLVRGQSKTKDNKPISEEEGRKIYYGGVGAVITDNEGNILYFDNNHNVKSNEDSDVKPIYFNIRTDNENNKNEINNLEDIANRLFEHSPTIKNIQDLKAIDTKEYNKLIEKARAIRNNELLTIRAIRQFIKENKNDQVFLDIDSVSKGVLNIRLEAESKINEIDWANSDIDLNISIHTSDSTSTKAKGGVYLDVPNYRPIPVSRNNISEEDMNNLFSLMFDDVKWKSRGKLKSVPAATKKELIETYILTRKGGIQIIVDNENLFVLLNGNKLKVTNEEDKQKAIEDLRAFMTTKNKTPDGKISKFNIREGQYKFPAPNGANMISEFSIKDGELTITPVPFSEHVAKNATISIIPNEQNRIVFLNGYINYSIPISERRKLGLSIDQNQSNATNGELKQVNTEPTEVVSKKDKLKQWVKDYFTKTKSNSKTLFDQISTASKIISKNNINTEAYTKEEQKQIAETFANIAKTVPQLAAFLTPIPGSGSILQLIKEKNETIKKILTITNEALEEYNKTSIPQAGEIESVKEIKPEVKAKEATNRVRRQRGNLSSEEDALNMETFLEMKASEKEVQKAKEWFDNSPLSKHIKFEQLFDVINSNAWAQFADSTIKLFAGSNYTALYHEAWHAFSQNFLTKKEKIDLYKEVAKTKAGQEALKNVDMNNLFDYYHALEELIAEDFRQYMLSNGSKILKDKPKRNSIFRRILNFLNQLFGKKSNTPNLNKLEELYNNLRIGNINQYNNSESNSLFSKSPLYKTITPLEGVQSSISDKDAKLLVDTIDSIIVDVINSEIASRGNNKFLSAYFTSPDLILKSSGKSILETVYDEVYFTLSDKVEDLKEELNNAEDLEKENITRKITLIEDALNNWGSPVQKEGMIAFHMLKSNLIMDTVKDLDEDAFNVTKEDLEATRFDKGGSELSSEDMASNQVIYLINTLNKYDKNNNLELNELGFAKLANKNQVWRKLINIISEKNNKLSPRTIYTALEENAKDEPWITDLLIKLGPLDTKDMSTNKLQTEFWATFYTETIKLYQLTINIETNPETGITTKEILPGYASAVFRHVERDFKSYFKSKNDSPFIKDSGTIGNVLDYLVLNKYRDNLKTVANKLSFLNDIGIPLADNSEVHKELEHINLDFIYQKLAKLQSHFFQITDVIEALKNKQEYKDENGNLLPENILPSETTTVNKILDLHARHSGEYANIGISTADGNTKYEQSQMSSLAVNIDTINNVKSFNELIALKHMSHLKYENNPMVTASIWLKSIFEFNELTQTFGKKREGVYLSIDDLSGVQNSDGINADYEYSTATAKADKYTRLLQDMYNSLLGGRFSTMTHADKSTTLSYVLNKINKNFSVDDHLYIDIKDFTEQGSEYNLAIEKMYDYLMPYLDGELRRIAKVKKQDGSISAIPGYTVKNEKGVIRGENLTIFDGVFSDETKKEIIKVGNVNDLSGELQDVMIKELNDYFRFSYKQTRKTLDDMIIVDDNMKAFLEKRTNKKLSSSEAERLMVISYNMNSFLHHIESLNLIYGDLAQYNMDKEEFHKRNAGIASTGRMFRYDDDAMEFINTVIRKPFSEKAGNKYENIEGTLNSVIFKENTKVSKMITHENGIEHSEYGKILYTSISKTLDRNKSPLKGKEREAFIIDKIKETLSPYNKMDEGDAQGWITFDSYRIMSILEGRWSNDQEKLFKQILENPNEISAQEVLEYFPPKKYQYFGPLVATGVSATAFHKFSLAPLIPTVIQDKNLEILNDQMMKQNVDYALFQSGSKVATIVKDGTDSADTLYSDSENRIVDTTQTYTKNTVHIPYLKDQLDINTHFKKKVIFSTQLRKLIEEGLIEGGVPTDFRTDLDLNERIKEWDKLDPDKKLQESKLYSIYTTYESNIKKLVDYRKEELKNEIGWSDDNNEANMKKLLPFLQDELSRQDLADHEIDFLKVDNKGNLVYDLSLSATAPRLEKALTAIVNQRLVRQKVNGEALIQVSSSLYENRKPTSEDLKKWGTNDLLTYRIGKDGKTLPMDVKVAFSGSFEKLAHLYHKDGEKIIQYKTEIINEEKTITKEIDQAKTLKRLNETIQDEEWRSINENTDLITLIGVRIPVQGLNSMEHMRVWEFLPREAGNIIVPPSEMVAKSGSDYDIDKLTVMMPNISINKTGPYLAKSDASKTNTKENQERVNNLKEEIKTTKQSIKNFSDAYDTLSNEERAKLTELQEQLKNLNDEKESLTAGAIENSILFNIKDILELPENAASLITPNDTNLVTELAKKLASNRDYKATDGAFDEVNENKSKKVSPTRVLEPAYNNYKHESNSVGKQTLGLGAIDNTFNVILNRVGAYLNPEYTNNIGAKKRVTILMKHQTLNKNNKDVISLSHMYDANNENKIADVISQLMNGWVDVAKDAWIFDIQGTKQVAPTLLFLIQAGVPLKEAVYFVSNPIVKMYVEEQKKTTSAFAKALNKNSDTYNFYRNKSQYEILKKLGLNHLLDDGKKKPIDRKLYKETIERTEDLNFDERNETIAFMSKEEAIHNELAVASFLHFLELEKIGSQLGNMKSKLNYDTSKSTTLFDAQKREADYEELLESNLFPDNMIKSIIDESPIGAFKVSDFQMQIWKNLFKLRNNENLNNFLSGLLKDPNFRKKMTDVFSTEEKYIEEFKNDLISQLFSNVTKSFNINSNSYKGIEMIKDNSYTQPIELVYEDNKPILKLNTELLTLQYEKGLYLENPVFENDIPTNKERENTYIFKGLAPISSLAFLEYGEGKNEFIKFSIERELIRDRYKNSILKDTEIFQDRLNANRNKLSKYELETEKEFEERLEKRTFEEFIRDEALTNILNYWSLFNSDNSYANQYFDIRNKYKLNERYELANDLLLSTSTPKGTKKTFNNLQLRDNRINKDLTEDYYNDLLKLMGHDTLNLGETGLSPELLEFEKQRINKFFKLFPLIAFMQSGINTSDKLSLVKIIPQIKIVDLLNSELENFSELLNDNNFLSNFKHEFNILNGKRNYSSRKRLKAYLPLNNITSDIDDTWLTMDNTSEDPFEKC